MKQWIRLFALALVAACAVSLSSAGTLSTQERAKIHPDFQALVAKTYPDVGGTGGNISRLMKVNTPGAENTYHAIVYTEDPVAVRAAGARVNSVYPGFVTAQVTADQIVALARLEGVRYIDEGWLNFPTNDVSIPETGASLVQGGFLNNTQYSGSGAIILIHDTGIDWKHKDFRSPADSTKSRILSIWDQTLTPGAGESSPSGFGYGVEYTQAQINAELSSSPPGFVREKDINGHGTHVAGTATGNGLALYGKFSGMAPGADIIVVKAGDKTFPDSYIIDGLTYAQNRAVALGKPVVVNWSLGEQDGPHDGTSADEVAVNSFVSNPGRVVAIAAGNDGANPIHIGGTAGATTSFTFTVPSYTPSSGTGTNQFLFDLWLNSNTNVSVSATSPDGYAASASYSSGGASGDGTSTADGVFTVNDLPSFTGNGAWNVQLWVRDDGVHFPKSGIWTLRVTNPGSAVRYDGWLAARTIGSGTVSLTGGDVNETVSMPGTSAGAITAAAYVTKWNWPVYTNAQYYYVGTDRTGDIATFSSIGPTRDGRQKPDLAAPGMGIASALSSFEDTTGLASNIYPGQKHIVLQGTSMATPHITGASALILGAFPMATAASIKALFTGGAVADAFTGSAPNMTWGYGKLDVLQAMAKQLSGSAPLTRYVLAYDGSQLAGYTWLTGPKKIAVRVTPTASGRLTGFVLHTLDQDYIPIRGSGSLVCEVYSDNGGVPGTRLGSSVTFPLGKLSGGTSNYIQMLGAGVSVTGATDVHIVVSTTILTDSVAVFVDNSTTGTRSNVYSGSAWSGRTYNFAFRAIVTSGGSTAASPIVTTNPATAVDSVRATLNGTINPNGTASAAWFELGPDSTLASLDTTAHQNVPSGSSPVAVSYVQQSLVSGTIYYYRLAAQNGAGLSRAGFRSFTTKTRTLPNYPASYALKDTVIFPSPSQASGFTAADYRLVGLPGNGTVLAGTFFTGTAEKDWRLSWDNGNPANYIDRYDGTAPLFTFSTGKAFWVLNRGPWTVSTTAPTAPLNASQQVEVPLHPGWNLITDPFNAPVSWSTVQITNGIADPIYSYGGSFSLSASFAPYTGYYYYNTPNALLLKVPYAAAFGATVPGAADPATWRISIAAMSGGRTDSSTSFGVAAPSLLSQRTLNFHKPRGADAAISTSFSRPGWDAKFPDYATDIRQESATLQEWSFDLRSAPGQRATLAFSGLRRVPASSEVWLIDEQDAMSVDLRSDSVYVMTPATPLCTFSVVVGPHQAVADRIAGARPGEFALGQNYPNPFNPSTTIPVSLPRDADASLRIYDILGREVLTLYAGPLEAGRHFFVWSGMDGAGRPVSSGLYIARFQPLNGPALTAKLLLMK